MDTFPIVRRALVSIGGGFVRRWLYHEPAKNSTAIAKPAKTTMVPMATPVHTCLVMPWAHVPMALHTNTRTPITSPSPHKSAYAKRVVADAAIVAKGVTGPKNRVSTCQASTSINTVPLTHVATAITAAHPRIELPRKKRTNDVVRAATAKSRRETVADHRPGAAGTTNMATMTRTTVAV